MAAREGTRRRTASLLAAVWAAGALTGCQTIADAASTSGCEGTESRVDDLKSYGVLDSRPQGTIEPGGFEGLDAGCWEDSGEAQLYAERTYVFPGDKADVTQHYRAAAEREGWKPSPATRRSSKADRPTNLCFTRDEAENSAMLDVYFLTKEILDAEETRTGPEFDSGVGYRVAVTSSADGSTTSCSD
ncbi:hypothetical protein ACH5AO_13500 [Streptomyces sp. NPDC018964]|uniref:hypothetical protein n=1 Tax=Streptomyces sp. NPDC018964 TaxID=3365058 RepID=UPI00379AD43D